MFATTFPVSLAIAAKGTLATFIVTTMGFWVASFYPTLYSLSTKGLGKLEGRASGVLTIGFLGAAFFPYRRATLPTRSALQQLYLIPLAACLIVGVFVLRLRYFDKRL